MACGSASQCKPLQCIQFCSRYWTAHKLDTNDVQWGTSRFSQPRWYHWLHTSMKVFNGYIVLATLNYTQQIHITRISVPLGSFRRYRNWNAFVNNLDCIVMQTQSKQQQGKNKYCKPRYVVSGCLLLLWIILRHHLTPTNIFDGAWVICDGCGMGRSWIEC
jgi:hypothetical protein